jgi:hypothetical protein
MIISNNDNESNNKDKKNHQSVLDHVYQKGYADGYRRHNQLTNNRTENESTQIWNVIFVITIFMLFLLGIFYTYNAELGKYSHYEGDCLIDLATTYSSKCLDN